MFLKEIEMQGFKSFADKTRIEFDSGVTAVVGPNGSGKSNITESLRWALGESSAKSLRGGKMPDVIFAGTQDRSPLNFAQVTVVLDNADHFIKDSGDEIRVERHIYRNGDSDYLIDGKKVRLRDIHDLFMDTGLGRDSFSIISQGRVEAIFNSRPEDRRAIFEEAAGVLKYKTRKKETQSKLDKTQDNLDRLEDIIYELEGQIKPLEKQAATAKQFLVLDEKRKSLNLNILIEDIKTYRSDLDERNQQIAAAKNDLKDYYSQRNRLEMENQRLKERRQNLSQTMDAQQSELLEVTRLIADHQRKIEVISLESSQKAEKKADAQGRLADLESQKQALEQTLADKQAQQTQLAEKLADLRQEIAKLEKEQSRFSTNPDQIIEDLREEFVGLMQKEADLSNRLTVLQADIEQEKAAQAEQSAERQQAEKDLAQAKEVAQTALAEFQTAKDRVKELLEAYQAQAKALSQTDSSYRQEQTQMFALLDQIKEKEARQRSLEAIQKNHSNFFAGVKAVLQEAARLGGIIGAVSEHLTFEQDYQTALEIALGGSSQNIIVEDEAAAKRGIAFLRQNRSGRATFLPLTTIKPRQIAAHNLTKIEAAPGFLGLASDLVSYDPKLTNIFQNLLGVTAIFDSIDHANQAAREVRYQVRMVTLDGTELRPGGSFSGGANRSRNTTFIKPELDSLTAEISDLKEKLTQQEAAVANLKRAKTHGEEELTGLKEAGEAARLAEQKAELAYQSQARHLADLKQLLAGFSATDTEDTATSLLEEKAKVESGLLDIQNQKAHIQEQLDQIKDDKDTITAQVAKLNEDLSQARLSERDLSGEERFTKNECNRLNLELADLEREISNLTQLLSSQTGDLSQEELPKLAQQLEEAEAKKSDLETSLIRLRFEIEDCDGQLEDIEEQVQAAGKRNEELIRRQAHLEAEIGNLSDKLRGFARQLTEDYQMSFEQAKEQAQAVEDLPAARQNLTQLNRQIKALGPINLDAIEQYDEVNSRLEFLNSQRSDLVEAKNLLLETINDMDDEVKSRFKTTFEAIRESFKETFVQMFGGGSADLILTEGDLLTAGVEISVQPPGKKIQSLNLMSGGEKALSALALLFSIIRVKTIPFVILDEVEAALDEANVKRFGDYLNRFDKASQFIVVTHRKGTMAAADSIYGVTMQESGVSKIVSVKLKDAQKMVET
ncbi:chromosome segregation protein SMC [Streptococcus tangpeifui]|uniref:chromosome segregation protein SMC n=1 Tax=Streptococcus tangpeifui TaxID=2709400 RepID=UPI0013EDDFC7|nr:chromosome segregation protein SMC [Streptococcus sp. ZJ1593]